MTLIATTGGRTDENGILLAKEVARDLKIPYVDRRKSSLKELKHHYNQDVLMIGRNRLEIHPITANEPVFFHPNSAMFRLKRIMLGLDDPFLRAVQLSEGMTFLDCTVGLASDSILASYVVGRSGKVVGVEGNRYLAYLVKRGLHEWNSQLLEMTNAMKWIEIVHYDHLLYLKNCPSDYFDVVYFDPMFEKTITESNGISSLKHLAVYSEITAEVLSEAKRVAKRRIVLKDHYQSNTFDKFNFIVEKRKTAKFHFGYLHAAI